MASADETTTLVAPGVRLSQNVADLGELAESPPERLRLYLGYAGWGAGQLVDEILRNDWMTAPVDNALIFTDDPETVWARALESVGVDPDSLPYDIRLRRRRDDQLRDPKTMARILLTIVLNGVGVFLAAYLVPGVTYTGSWPYLLLVGLVIGLINLLVRPLITLLSLPAVILTLGLFLVLINGVLFWLASLVLDHLTVHGFWAAILGGLVLALFNWLTKGFVKKSKK